MMKFYSIRIKPKHILLLIFPLLLLSCRKSNSLPRIETVTSGSKWNLQTGSAPADVYRQLQLLGPEKGFSEVALAYRQPLSRPEELHDRLKLYRAVTLQKNSGYVDRVIFQFSEDKVGSIYAGGALPDSIFQWPQDDPGEATIHQGDPVGSLYNKLILLYQLPAYSNYQLILPDKPLEKPYDPDMANYSEWRFDFSVDVRPGRKGTSSVSLYFESGKLKKIVHVYNEVDVFN